MSLRIGLNYVLDYLCKMPIAEITKSDLTNAFTPLVNKYADGVIQKAYTIVKLIFNKACAEGDIPKDPTAYWKRPKSNISQDKCKNRSNPSTCTEKSCHLIGIILPPRRRCLPPISVFFITEALHTVPVPAQMASGTVRRQPHGKRLASVKGSS